MSRLTAMVLVGLPLAAGCNSNEAVYTPIGGVRWSGDGRSGDGDIEVAYASRYREEKFTIRIYDGGDAEAAAKAFQVNFNLVPELSDLCHAENPTVMAGGDEAEVELTCGAGHGVYGFKVDEGIFSPRRRVPDYPETVRLRGHRVSVRR